MGLEKGVTDVQFNPLFSTLWPIMVFISHHMQAKMKGVMGKKGMRKDGRIL